MFAGGVCVGLLVSGVILLTGHSRILGVGLIALGVCGIGLVGLSGVRSRDQCKELIVEVLTELFRWI